MECVIGYVKMLCAGTAVRGVRLKYKNCDLTVMLSTNRYKNHSRIFSRSSLIPAEVLYITLNFCTSFKALQ